MVSGRKTDQRLERESYNSDERGGVTVAGLMLQYATQLFFTFSARLNEYLTQSLS